ncbi:DUF2975 domain-containing protein [Egibacter rhizosphaerae]|uniref:DUF2975 domain-containing protein n=1 Tax=Egibacter rhizosphaerae TaxID=1670831 RepID=A0A411YG83_9ACTN|nr:DUF2975 domain-containing protein [Egibacter rhizosphaerae]QBI20092.1 DUF2975 domain-containing protein [Egibacter rhizosphaerae]
MSDEQVGGRDGEATEPEEPTEPDEPVEPVGGGRLLAGFVMFVAVVVLVAVGVEAVVAVGSSGADVAVGVEDVLLDEAAVEDGLPDGTHLEADEARYRLVADTLPLALRLLTVAGTLVGGLLGVTGAWLLAQVLRDIGSGRPFTGAAPGRLRWLAVVVLASALFPRMLDGAAAAAVFDHLGIAESPASLSYTILQLDAGWLLLAAVLMVLAQAFAHGQRLAQDVEGLV